MGCFEIKLMWGFFIWYEGIDVNCYCYGYEVLVEFFVLVELFDGIKI